MGTRFVHKENIEENMMSEIKKILKEDFGNCYKYFYSQLQECITSDGIYFDT